MAEDNSNINPKDELLDAVAQLDDEGDRVIELTDDETGEVTQAIVDDTFEMNGKTYIVLIVDSNDEEDVSYYEIMQLIDKDGDIMLENVVGKEADILYDYYDKLCEELYGDDEESEDE